MPDSVVTDPQDTSPQGRRRMDDDTQEFTVLKRRVVPVFNDRDVGDMQKEADYYKQKAAERSAQVQENQNFMVGMRDQMKVMSIALQQNAAEHSTMAKEFQKEKETMMAGNKELVSQVQSFRQWAESQMGQQQNAFVENQELHQQLQSSQKDKEAQEKKAKEFERRAADKANEAAALRAKLANQAAGQTPRTRKTKIMGDAEMRAVATKIPIIPYVPIPCPGPNTGAGNSGPNIGADNRSAAPAAAGSTTPFSGDMAQLAAEVAKFMPGASVHVARSPKKKRVLRDTKKAKCGVENDEQFVLKETATEAEVLACEGGSLQPHLGDYRFDFNIGYRNSRWNQCILDKIIVLAQAEGKHLDPAPKEWLYDKLHAQMIRAREAWARPNPRGNESTEQSIARANAYREDRATKSRVTSNKTRKFNSRMETVVFVIKLKAGTNAPDLEAWKRILQMLMYLDHSGMSSEEETEITEGNNRSTGFRVKVCVWRAEDVGQYLTMVDAMGKKLVDAGRMKPQGPKPAVRLRDGTPSDSGAPRSLPRSLYNEAWIQKNSAISPVFYDDLKVSKDVFHLLVASADMVQQNL
ncbi:hypothetical protein K438DRAFT_1967241 [Mycena galopus ATCC 62051]|nr:hypothetical protein K438DRAFT_1967241 [Mycena galopus ATCC 62051]